jgi:hypothetical protein
MIELLEKFNILIYLYEYLYHFKAKLPNSGADDIRNVIYNLDVK